MATAAQETAQEAGKKVVVFGGSGFVGSRVLAAASKLGCEVVSVNRKGRPEGVDGGLVAVKWVKADVFEPDSWREEMTGATGVVTCLGGFGSDEFMEKLCGDSNVLVADEAAKAGVEKCVFISAAGAGYRDHAVLKGYWKGKQKAEEEILQRFPLGGVVLRAPAIYGARKVGPITVPLGLAMRPMEMIFQYPPFTSLRRVGPLEVLFTPPVNVEAVGKAAVAAAVGLVPPGVYQAEDINKYAKLV